VLLRFRVLVVAKGIANENWYETVTITGFPGELHGGLAVDAQGHEPVTETPLMLMAG